MELIEEENPLESYTDVRVSRVGINYKNNVGRPTKNSEIKFSPQPKSIISILLSKEEKDDSKILINQRMETTPRQNESTLKDSSEGTQYKKRDNKKSIIFQENKLYQCNHVYCTYATKYQSNLKTHKRIHTNEQLYICDECTFKSKFISSLKTHKRLHRDERPFGCQSCEYRCNSRSNLKKHIARKHKKILPTNETKNDSLVLNG